MWTRLLLKVTAHPEIKKKSCTHYNHRFKGGSFVACKKHFTASRQNSVAAFSYITEEDGWGLVLRREKTTEVKNKMAPHDRKPRGESDLSFFSVLYLWLENWRGVGNFARMIICHCLVFPSAKPSEKICFLRIFCFSARSPHDVVCVPAKTCFSGNIEIWKTFSQMDYPGKTFFPQPVLNSPNTG